METSWQVHACLARSLTCLATSPVCPDASPLRLGQESRRDWTRPEERAALRGCRRGRCSCPLDSSPCRLRNPVGASRSFLVGIQPRQSVDRRDLSSGASHQSIRECRRSRGDTCDEPRIRRRHLSSEAVARPASGKPSFWRPPTLPGLSAISPTVPGVHNPGSRRQDSRRSGSRCSGSQSAGGRTSRMLTTSG